MPDSNETSPEVGPWPPTSKPVGITAPDDLAARRERRDGSGLRRCEQCDGAWWRVNAVNLSADGRVTGYAGPLACRECGHVPGGGSTVDHLNAHNQHGGLTVLPDPEGV